jgi:hypothetical protein
MTIVELDALHLLGKVNILVQQSGKNIAQDLCDEHSIAQGVVMITEPGSPPSP